MQNHLEIEKTCRESAEALATKVRLLMKETQPESLHFCLLFYTAASVFWLLLLLFFSFSVFQSVISTVHEESVVRSQNPGI